MSPRLATLLLALVPLVLVILVPGGAFGEAKDESKRSSRGVFTNTLGMEFVPVKAAPGILFCRWETRVKDFRTFCEDTDRVHEGPAFPQGDDHPVVNVSYNDAMEFCAWLSEKEGKKYRLPKDHEWSAAVGIAHKEDAGEFPKFKGIECPREKRREIEKQFPWGAAWPPPVNTGNFDQDLRVDSYQHTSPVGMFAPSADGLYDLAGNTWEWCDSIYEDKEHYRVMRGGSWRYADPMFALSAFRGRGNTPTRHDTRGFRVVLEMDEEVAALLRPIKKLPAPRPPADRKLPKGSGEDRERISVLLIGGRGSHDWHGFHDTIAPVLEETGDFHLKLTPNVDDLETATLARYQVVLFYGPGGDFANKAEEDALHDYVKKGGGLVGVHATDAFKKSDVYWRLLGGRFVTHRGGEFWIRIMDEEHPVTAPFGDFKIHDETYQTEYHPQFKLHSLFRMDRGEEQQSMGWVQEYGKGRVFNTTLGHDHKAWRNEHFQKVVLRGIYWAAGREPR